MKVNVLSIIWIGMVSLFFLFHRDVAAQNLLSNDLIWASSQLRAQSPGNFSFLTDGRHYTRLDGLNLNVYDIETGEWTRSVFSEKDISSAGYSGPDFDGYQFGPKEAKVLLSTSSEKIYRYSKKAYYYVFDRASGQIEALDSAAKQLYPTFSPNGTKVAYVKDNNLFVKDLADQKIQAITTKGKWNELICGAADWVYEEELKLTRAFEWSPDGQYLAYMEFDESEVEQFSMKYYTDGPYPKEYRFKYPKVGEKNARVSVFIADVAKLEKRKLPEPSGWSDYYVPRIQWMPGTGELVVTYLNRLQKHLVLRAYDAARSGIVRNLLEEKSPYYISIHDHLQFLPDQEQFIWSSERNGWNQLLLFNYGGEFIRPLSDTGYDVTACYGYDEKSNRLYFQAAVPRPEERRVLSVSLGGGAKDTVLNKPGWNSASFSSDYSYFIGRNATINTPPTYTIMNPQGEVIRELVQNERLSDLQSVYSCQPIDFEQIQIDDSVSLNSFILYPGDFDSTRQYPVLMHVYGGPNSQQVVDNWKGKYYWWFQMLAQKGFIVMSVDNRGTGARGEAFRKMTYKQLGRIESNDQIDAARLISKKNYVDPDNVSIFGWSYGGYLSSLALLKGNDVFSSGIAVAPVTNWKWYDSIYTERYMQTYERNEKGYDTNAPIFYADRLEGRYLLVHGLADDNVHFQHTAEMSNALIAANKQFDTYLYPNRNHGIYGSNARRHLFDKITNFLLKR
ncbi:MAG: prolyl oligopeptidase family serine peptidase [Bacteroidetes bacterium]|nr:prolyl oligopeptidase family serine peptidase [Bacteroidota bacterium]